MEGETEGFPDPPPDPPDPPQWGWVTTQTVRMLAENARRSRPTQRAVIELRLTSDRIRWIGRLLEVISALHRAGCSVAKCPPEDCHDIQSDRQWTALCMA